MASLVCSLGELYGPLAFCEVLCPSPSLAWPGSLLPMVPVEAQELTHTALTHHFQSPGVHAVIYGEVTF